MKLQEHPLWSTLKEWAASSAPPIVEFAPMPEFQRNIDLAVLIDPIWGHEDAKEGFLQTYKEAAALGKALVGGSYNIYVHAMLYRVSAHNLGLALCRAASIAYTSSDLFADFSDSTRLDGFVKALEAWASRFLQKHFDGKEELAWVNRNLVGKNEPAADFWLNACKMEIGDASTFANILAKEVGRAKAAGRMKAQRKANPKTSTYKDWIQCFWIPAAFWCKSDAEIVSILDPDRKTNMTDAYDRVRRDISDLGFSHSRLKSS